MTDQTSSHMEGLPVKRSLNVATITTLIVAALMAAASIAGLLYRITLYPAGEAGRWFALTDGFNLAVGLPLLLVSLWLARRGRLIGLLCWPGMLFYALYVYIPYVIAVPVGPLFLAHLAIVSLSAYTIIGVGVSVDGEAVHQRLADRVPVRWTGGILLALALLTIGRQVAQIIGAMGDPSAVARADFATWIGDLAVMCPALIVAGVQLWQRKPLGYVAGAGLLLQFGVLALSLVPGMVTVSPVDVAGVVIVLVMALICLIPFGLFASGAKQTSL